MADISNKFVQLRKNTNLPPGQNWESRVAADANGDPWYNRAGSQYAPLISGFAQQIPVWPGNPLFMIEAWDLDGTANSTVADAAAVATAVNKGAQTNAGAATSWARGSAGGITLRKTPADGRDGNLPRLRTDGTGWMQTTPAVTALAQPMTVAIVFSIDSLATGAPSLFDALGATRAWITITPGTGVVNMGSAGGAVPTTAVVAGSQYNTLIAVYNGANSFVRLNGVQTGVVNPTMTGGATGMTLFSLIGGVAPMTAGDCLLFGCWTDGTSPALIESCIAGILGTNPQ